MYRSLNRLYAPARPDPQWSDVIVSGGGMVGCAMMASLQQLRRRWLTQPARFPTGTQNGTGYSPTGFAARCVSQEEEPPALSRLMLVDSASRPRRRPAAAAAATDLFLRTVNVTPVSSRILDNLGVWSKLRTKHAVYRIAVRHEDATRDDFATEWESNGHGPCAKRADCAQKDSMTSTGSATSMTSRVNPNDANHTSCVYTQDGPMRSNCPTRRSFLGRLCGGKRPAHSALLDFTDVQSPLGFICANEELHTVLLDVIEADAVSSRQGRCGEDVLLFDTAVEKARVAATCGGGGASCAHARERSSSLPPYGFAELVHRVPRPARPDPASDVAEACVGDGAARRALPPQPVRFGLLLGCDGRHSAIRQAIQSPLLQYDYGQTAFVCTAHVERVDDGNVCAFQNFCRDGSIVGMLPLSDDTVNIIYSTSPVRARELMSCGEAELVGRLNRALCDWDPRDIPRITRIAADASAPMRGSFPLSLHVATRVCGPRMILLGDAAHAIHPFAGQGFNLGLYDVCVLTSILDKAVRSGQAVGVGEGDAGGASMLLGAEFAGSVLAHTAPMIMGMEAIKQILYALPTLGVCGMRALNTTPFLSDVCKSHIMHFASGSTFASRHANSFLLR